MQIDADKCRYKKMQIDAKKQYYLHVLNLVVTLLFQYIVIGDKEVRPNSVVPCSNN
jgi:hypothetical protein